MKKTKKKFEIFAVIEKLFGGWSFQIKFPKKTVAKKKLKKKLFFICRPNSSSTFSRWPADIGQCWSVTNEPLMNENDCCLKARSLRHAGLVMAAVVQESLVCCLEMGTCSPTGLVLVSITLTGWLNPCQL